MIAILIFLAGPVRAGPLERPAHRVPGFQGLGAGGLMVGAIMTLDELVPTRERGQY